MPTNESFVAFAAAYSDGEDAQAAFIKLREGRDLFLHLTAASVRKDENGRLHLHQRTKAGKQGAVFGAVGAAVATAIFPPAGLAAVTTIAVASAGLGTIGHFAGGVSRKELKELGSVLDEGEGAIIAVAGSGVAAEVEAILAGASKLARVDVDQGDVDAAIADLKEQVVAPEPAADTAHNPDGPEAPPES